MEEFNVKRIKAIGNPIASIPAEDDIPKEVKGHNGDNESGLPKHLLLCKGMKFRLRSNLWTAAGLVNGAIGHVHSIIYGEGEKPPQMPRGIIATFEGYIGPSYLPDVPNSVPIVPVRRTWIFKGKTCNRTQLPLIPSYALSIHRLQGATEDKIILNPGNVEFAAGLLLVGASRTKALEDLAFDDPMPNFVRFEMVNKHPDIKRRKQEEARMAKLETKTVHKYRDIISECFDFYDRDIQTLGENMFQMSLL